MSNEDLDMWPLGFIPDDVQGFQYERPTSLNEALAEPPVAILPVIGEHMHHRDHALMRNWRGLPYLRQRDHTLTVQYHGGHRIPDNLHAKRLRRDCDLIDSDVVLHQIGTAFPFGIRRRTDHHREYATSTFDMQIFPQFCDVRRNNLAHLISNPRNDLPPFQSRHDDAARKKK